MNREKTLQEAAALLETLKKESAAPKGGDLKQVGKLLAQLKIKLAELSFLAVESSTAGHEKEMLLAREVLELGAQYSIRTKDIPSFERYVSQLQTYYFDFGKSLAPSPRMYVVLGLNLLRLLAQNQIADFHAQLELIDPDQLLTNVYIQHPVHLEQCLMEGRYNKVWHARADVPAEEYLFFMDILMETIRHEIAQSSEKAYTSVPMTDAVTMFCLKDSSELVAFAQKHGWKLNAAEKKIYFDGKEVAPNRVPSQKLVEQFLGYARELERIV